nr:reverse transcriptase domain-containing protein [Tanacetum cinerariifolium]GEW86654.1 reverse transcriptase domain-containing protein [Tanacetum cinerariifolium]
MAAISIIPQLVDKKGGSYFAVAYRLEPEKINKWKKRMLFYLTRIEPYYIQCIKDGPFKLKTAEGADKPEAQWTLVERNVVNQDQHLKSIIISCLPNNIMEPVISCETAKDTWTDLVYSFECPSDTKENMIMDLKLEYQTFRAKSFETFSQTYTYYKTLLNDLANDDVILSKHEINVGFMNSLPKKWLCFSQGLRTANHTQTLDLTEIYGSEQLTDSSSKNDAKDNPFVPASLDYDHEIVLKSKDWVERLNPDSKLLNFNTERILVPEMCCDDAYHVTPCVSAMTGRDRLVSEPVYREVADIDNVPLILQDIILYLQTLAKRLNASSTVTYTLVYSDYEPWRFQWVSYVEPEALEDTPQFPKVFSTDEVPIKDQPQPADASPTTLSPGYIVDSDPEEDLEDDPEEDPADYPTDGGDENEEESSGDDADDEDKEEASKEEDEDEKEEHLAPADSSAEPIDDPVPLAEEIGPFETDAATKALIATVDVALPSSPPPPSPLLKISSPSLPLPSPPLPLPAPSSPLLSPATDRKEDVPEADIPPQKRLCLTAPTHRFKVRESSAANAARQPRLDVTHATVIVSLILDMEERAPTTLKELSQRLTNLTVTLTRDTHEMHAWQAWSQAMDSNRAVHAELLAYRAKVKALHEQIRPKSQSPLEIQSLRMDQLMLKIPPNRTTTTTTPIIDATIKALIAQGVGTALAEYEANRGSGNGDDSHDSKSDRRTQVQGHYKKDCSKLKNKNQGNSARNDGATAKAYALGNVGKNPDSNVVTDHDYDVELADGKIIRVNTIIRGCTLTFLNHPFNIDLMPVEIGSFDVIIGMDWLSMYDAVIICDEKIIRIPFGNEILIVRGDGSNNGHESRLNIISCTKTQEYLLKGFHVFLAHVTPKKSEDKSKEK